MSMLVGNQRVSFIHGPTDPGVDDTEDMYGLMAAIAKGAPINFLGFVPQSGNSVLSDGERNTACSLKLAKMKYKIYPGAIAPLALQGNKTAIRQFLSNTKKFGFYGADGWPTGTRQELCPHLTTQIECEQGDHFMARAMMKATADEPLVIMSTASLTTLASAFQILEQKAERKGIPVETWTQNVVIYMMAGCVDPRTCGPNAPFNLPDFDLAKNCTTSPDPHFDPPCKISEANLYADTPAAQYVFNFCKKRIRIYLIPLDLTQQTALLWTPAQTDYLFSLKNNRVAQGMATIARPVPIRDAPCFPPYNGTNYPMHDGITVQAYLRPELFKEECASYSVGDVGQLLINPNATDEEKTVCALSMDLKIQEIFWNTVLPDYGYFNQSLPKRTLFAATGALSFLSVSFFSFGKPTSGAIAEEGQHCYRAPLTPTEIVGILASAVTLVALALLVTYGCLRSRRNRREDAERPLLDRNSPITNYGGD